jgi:hypothetical protein
MWVPKHCSWVYKNIAICGGTLNDCSWWHGCTMLGVCVNQMGFKIGDMILRCAKSRKKNCEIL